MIRLSGRPAVWGIAFLAWFVTLWFLSDGPVPADPGFEIPHLDKVLHFGYFFGGAGLLHALLYLRFPGLRRAIRHLVVILALAAIGALDEWHQSWIPERSGNDPGDWLADTIGAAAGGLVFDHFRTLFRKKKS